jgi:CRISPR-associated protein Cas2
MEEYGTVVIYDIPDDRTRLKISEACLDYGLERVQYSAFSGKLSRNKREELFLRLQALLADKPGKILVQPICEKDLRQAKAIENRGGPEQEGEAPS